METVRRKKISIKSWCILAGLCILFLGMLAAFGVGVYNDSEQYITMHIHREPLYPLFLALFRKVCGDGYLTVAAAAQGILTAVAIWLLAEYITCHFKLCLWEQMLVILIQIVPHVMTRYVSALHIFLESSVMSEALCIPLFHFFQYFLLRMLFEQQRRDRILALIFAFLLSMTRGQMMITILLWMVLYLLQMILQKKYRLLIVPLIAVIAVFGMRSLTVHLYNYAVTGYFMGNTYGKVNTLTNVIYACDEEDRTVFEEGSLEQKFFDRFYTEADAMGLNYKYGGESFRQRAEHLEAYHDVLKFQVLEANLSAYYFSLGEVDYYQQSSMSDEMAGVMLKKLLPACFGQWLYDYILLCSGGFVRSIAVVHPLINFIALVFYGVSVFLVVWLVFYGRQYDTAWIMATALLFIAANVCATSMTIMCLSRYMIYGFSFFYTAFYLSLRGFMKRGERNGIS